MNLAQGSFDDAKGEGEAGGGVNALLDDDGADMRRALRRKRNQRLVLLGCEIAHIAEHGVQLVLALLLVQLEFPLAENRLQHLFTVTTAFQLQKPTRCETQKN